MFNREELSELDKKVLGKFTKEENLNFDKSNCLNRKMLKKLSMTTGKSKPNNYKFIEF